MVGLLLFVFVFMYSTIKLYKRKGLTPSFFLFALYSLSGIAALLLVLFYNEGNNSYIKDYNEGMIYLLFALLLFLYPFVEMKDDKIDSLTIPSWKIMKPFIWVLTLLSYFSIFYFFPVAKAMLFVDIGNVAALRDMVARGEHPFISQSIFNTVAGTVASFFVLQILSFFLLLLIQKRISWEAAIVLFSSFSYPLFVLAYLGRDGILFWFFSFMSYALLFYRYLPRNVVKKMKRLLVIAAVPFVVVFLFITVGRFVVNGNSDGVLYPMLNYLGQGPINFAEFYYTDVRTMGWGANMFPLFFGAIDDIGYLLERYDIKTWVFKTFISSIYMDFGSVLTLLLGILLILLFRVLHKKDLSSHNLSISFLILFGLFFSIYSQGVFYFRQYNRIGNLFIIVMLLLAFIFAFLPKKKIYLR